MTLTYWLITYLLIGCCLEGFLWSVNGFKPWRAVFVIPFWPLVAIGFLIYLIVWSK